MFYFLQLRQGGVLPVESRKKKKKTGSGVPAGTFAARAKDDAQDAGRCH